MFSGGANWFELSLFPHILKGINACWVLGNKEGPIKFMGCIVTLELFYVSNGIFYTEVGYGNKGFSLICKQISWIDLNLVLVHYVEIKIIRYEHNELPRF